MPAPNKLSRREREIMDVIFLLEQATATEIQERLSDPPSNTAVRTHLRILEEKGVITRRQDGKRFIYRAKQSKKRVGKSALGQVLKVYFGQSLQKAVAAHLADPKANITEDELDALDELIREARIKQERKKGQK